MISRRRIAFSLFGLFFAAQAFAQGGAAAPRTEAAASAPHWTRGTEPAADVKAQVEAPASVPRWGMFEVKITGFPGNPERIDGSIMRGDVVDSIAEGFRDGDQWRIRFMPSMMGKYRFSIGPVVDFRDASGEEKDQWYLWGSFEVTEPEPGSHGPVHQAKTFHFAHEDGTPFYPVGTTCYAWLNQPEPIRKQTIETLSKGYFNKIRFCIFPKHYVFNEKEPDLYPFLLKENSEKEYDWDYTKPNPAYFARIDEAVETLGKLGIECDLILFHPYDKWGFSKMPAEANDFYLTYMAARYSAYANVWWSFANEYDIMKNKTVDDWEHYAALIQKKDWYHHLRSIHNCVPFYDYTKPWITHCSIQRQDFYVCAELTDQYRRQYNKPVVLDEIQYEGDIPYMWGNIAGPELVRRFWEAAVRGGYATHGETYVGHDGVLWWSHGGKLWGDSAPRLKFLKEILYQTPGLGLRRTTQEWDDLAGCAEGNPNYLLFYFGRNRPKYRDFNKLDPNASYHVEVIDTWNMTIDDRGIMKGRFHLDLPGKEFIAIRVVKVKNK